MIDVSKSELTTSGDSLMVTGSGFMPGEPVVLMLRIDENLSIVLVNSSGEQQVIADMSGGFTVTYDVIDISPSVRTWAVGDRAMVVATGSDGSRASYAIEVVNGSPDSHHGRRQGDSST